MRPPASDPKVRRFIRLREPPETFTHLAAELRSLFGIDLTAAQASHLWRTLRHLQPGKLPLYESNGALMAFITDRADLTTLDGLRREILEAFGRPLTPSRTQLHRLVQRVRARAAEAYSRRA
jgi:hypothetical protein